MTFPTPRSALRLCVALGAVALLTVAFSAAGQQVPGDADVPGSIDWQRPIEPIEDAARTGNVQAVWSLADVEADRAAAEQLAALLEQARRLADAVESQNIALIELSGSVQNVSRALHQNRVTIQEGFRGQVLAVTELSGAAQNVSRANQRLRQSLENGLGSLRRSVDRLASAQAPPELPGRATIDPNTADAATLTRLPGIGPVTAARIVAYRDEHGPFADAGALLAVPGVGPATLEAVRPFLTFEVEPAEPR